MVARAYNPQTQEAESGDHHKFRVTLVHRVSSWPTWGTGLSLAHK